MTPSIDYSNYYTDEMQKNYQKLAMFTQGKDNSYLNKTLEIFYPATKQEFDLSQMWDN
ncbi:hypothetical protein MICCA_1060081 [Microcystis aeruginosa PCC 9432]|uniref:Uncharacterized protein n=2 Tax=Microcystis aeruginosa TaxID=1126 RepID=A0A822L6X7_MICAE|nr:hypothetical protein MICCA_1060081 [Microcystis aeruginosa PCC 9432]